MDGFWTAEFGSSTGVLGGGVAVLQDGSIVGGDGGYFYRGQYTVTGGNAFHATIEVIPFIENYPSVFKTVNQKLTLELVGSLQGSDQAIAQGQARGMPHLKFGVKLTKRA